MTASHANLGNASPILAARALVVRRGFGDFAGAIVSRNVQFNWIFDGNGLPLGYVPPISPGRSFDLVGALLKSRGQSVGATIRNAFSEATSGDVYQGVDIMDLPRLRAATSDSNPAQKTEAFAAAARGEGVPVLRVASGGSTLTVSDPSGTPAGEVSSSSSLFGSRSFLRFYSAEPDPQRRHWKTPKNPEVGSVPRGAAKHWPVKNHEVLDAQGATVARVGPVEGSSRGFSYRLEKLGGVGDLLNSLLVAYLCALLDEKWTSSVMDLQGRGEPGL